MKTSEKGLSLIKRFEGCHLTAYRCPAGVWTIGYGHTDSVSEGDTITQSQADTYLAKDIEKFERYVSNTGLTLSQNQFDALVSFAYNCGNGSLKKLIAGRSLDEIADALLLYTKANGVSLPGLARRRQAERDLFVTKEDGEMVKPVDYKQNDSKWGSLPYAVDGEKSTIKSAGCGPTAMADVLASIVDPYIDPVTCASWARMHGYKAYKAGTYHSYIQAQAAEYGVSCRQIAKTKARTELINGNWLIAVMGPGIWTSSGHYIVAYGYKDDMVYINDPASTKASRACNKWTTFLEQAKKIWVVIVPDDIKRTGRITGYAAYRQKDFVREIQYVTGSALTEKLDGLTLSRTVTLSARKNRKHSAVLAVQKKLHCLHMYEGTMDQVAGPKFTDAVNMYQKKVMRYPKTDGEITAKGRMWKNMLQ